MREPDPLIRRLQIGALVWCAGLTTGSLALFPDRLAIAGGIAGGGVLTAVSFYAIKSSIDALLTLMAPAQIPHVLGAVDVQTPPTESPEAEPPIRRRSPVAALLRLVGRYALLGVLAYVMIARLRLHPVGLIVGASSLVASAAFEAGRALLRPAQSPPARSGRLPPG